MKDATMPEEADRIGRGAAIAYVKRIENAMKRLGHAGEGLPLFLTKDRKRRSMCRRVPTGFANDRRMYSYGAG